MKMARENWIGMTNQHWHLTATHDLRDHLEARTLARLMLDAATDKRFAHLVAPDAALSNANLQLLNDWLERAKAGEPWPYILRRAPFFGRDWHVEAGVLIPRPETEHLVEGVLECAPEGALIAELGTGSGIIAGTIALERPQFSLWATELSPVARDVARRNWEELGAHIHILEGDLGNWLGPLHNLPPLDVIASNPPYIPSGEIGSLQTSVREFEPRLALDGGKDGLASYRQIAAGGRAHLRGGGFVALEVGHDQRGPIEAIFCDWARIQWKFDVQGIARIALVWK